MTEPIDVGDTFADKYRVEAILGKGSMATVLGARHLGLNEPVAIKVLHADMFEVPGMVERFVREARAASKIKGEHVVRVTDVDMLKNGVPFMIMERLDGADLAEVCKERGVLPIREAVDYVLQACEALAEAHALGIIHRDLKPANLFLARRPDGTTLIKVLDFGISKVTTNVTGEHYVKTAVGAMLGSPSYMSPEQMASARDVDPRTDIWALGVILYRLLTGELPFQAATASLLIKVVLKTSPSPPSKLRPDLPPELDKVILRCLEKDRTRRFASVAELAGALIAFAREHFSAQWRALSVPPTEAFDRPTTPSLSSRPPGLVETLDASRASLRPSPWRSRSRRSVLVAAGVLLILGGVVGVTLWRRPPAHLAPGGDRGGDESAAGALGPARQP